MAWFSVLLLVLVPVLGVARLDLWGGQHLALGRPVSATKAVLALCFAGAGTYFITFVVNLFGGRLFCGFGCPISYATRLSEAASLGSTPRFRRLTAGYLPVYAAAFWAALLLWVVDPRVLVEGSAAARAAVLVAWAAGTASVVLHGRLFGWRFCESWCPVGLYYSVVAPTKSFGIRFQAKNCIDCNACDTVCPVHLPPRTLLRLVDRPGSFALSGAPAVNHCLSCGDCVEACEMVLRKKDVTPIPLSFDWRPFRDETPGARSDGISPARVLPENEGSLRKETRRHDQTASTDGALQVGAPADPVSREGAGEILRSVPREPGR